MSLARGLGRIDLPFMPNPRCRVRRARSALRPRAFAIVADSILAAHSGKAQIVRGVVTERTSGNAVAGVLIALERVPPAADAVARVLSNDRGEFAASAREPGQYILTAKRIGVRRFVSSPFAIGPGETRRMDIVLDPVSTTLPAVEITGITACRGRTDALRLAALWEEARTALTATQTAVYDRSAQASVFRYTRILEPRHSRSSVNPASKRADS